MDEYLKLLEKYKFEKYLNKLNKKLNGKRVVIYGAGTFFKKIKENYDLSKLNIVGISDIKYSQEQEGSLDYGYKIIPKDNLEKHNTDVVLIAVLNCFQIYKGFKKGKYRNSKIKFYPLVDKPFFELLIEAFS